MGREGIAEQRATKEQRWAIFALWQRNIIPEFTEYGIDGFLRCKKIPVLYVVRGVRVAQAGELSGITYNGLIKVNFSTPAPGYTSFSYLLLGTVVEIRRA